MSRRPIAAIELLAIVWLLCACDAAAAPAPEAVTPAAPAPTTHSRTVEPSQAGASPGPGACGVGVLGAHARMWMEGPDALHACSSLTIKIQQQGNQPVGWDGIIIGSAIDYRPVCARAVPTITYEVIDTGSHLIGTTWCQWVVEVYGASNTAAALDIFGIVGQSQQTEVAQQHRDAATSQPIATATQKNDQATQATRQRAYASGCGQYNGYIENGFCLVDYPASPKWAVAINYDGTWNAAQADFNRRNCANDAQLAARAAQDGHAWLVPPQYHSDTGVCIQGHP